MNEEKEVLIELEPTSEEEFEFTTKARWAVPHNLDNITFVGKDVLAVACDVYIIFFNFKANTETVYVANNEVNGDGVDLIAGHRHGTFAFAEKCNNPRIMVLNYPSFNLVTELKDLAVNRYKGLCMMECDLIAGFSGFPNYIITIWNWRSSQRLISLGTGVGSRRQMFQSSCTQTSVCECWDQGLVVWEVGQVYHKTFLIKRTKEEKNTWDLKGTTLIDVCWTNDGQLYAIDSTANLYSVSSDGTSMRLNLEWSENTAGINKPSICGFLNGILLVGTDGKLRTLKKYENSWKVEWQHRVDDAIERLVSNTNRDVAVLWTDPGYVYRITAESEEKVSVKLFTFKQRHIVKCQLIAPNFEYLVTLNCKGHICIYKVVTGQLMSLYYVEGNDKSFESSPVDPLIVVFGEVEENYGMALLEHADGKKLVNVGKMCLSHQIVSRVAFSPTGRQLIAAAMSAGHVFIFELSEDYKLNLVRYAEIGRGLADCFLMQVGEFMRAFFLILYSDKYCIGERIVCINAITGKDNKLTGKIQGPYSKLLPLNTPDTLLAIPHLSRHYHVLRASTEKGGSGTVTLKIVNIIEAGHDIRQFDGFATSTALITFGFAGNVILRQPHAPAEYEIKLIASHRFGCGFKQVLIDGGSKYIVTLAQNKILVIHYLNDRLSEIREDVKHEPVDPEMFEVMNKIYILDCDDKTYLELQKEKKVREETTDYKQQRAEVLKIFDQIRTKLVELLEKNLTEIPLHQLPLSEFNLHTEAKKERLKQAEKEREDIRLKIEARIKAQDKVTAWIKKNCWDTMLAPRVKLFAIFSHHNVENYAVLPTQRENWPELLQAEALRGIEMENAADLFRPWEEIPERKEFRSGEDELTLTLVGSSKVQVPIENSEDTLMAEPYVLSGTFAHKYIKIPNFVISQTMAYSYLQMNWQQNIVKFIVQNMRLWFNKQFDDLMNLKKREVGLVEERNSRLRFIISELNELSDLRGSFHHLAIIIKDPEWRQEEQPHRLIKVDPEECSIEPYISPSEALPPPPELKPKDDFRARALFDMMDGVLEKLWHEEIKKPVPKPQCMVEKDPEHWNEDDLRTVFDYEAKVTFRNEERDKYRKMLHAEYSKLSAVLNEGVVNFNVKVKNLWLTRLKVESVIIQENLTVMRLRRVNLDRLEMAEKLEQMRTQLVKHESNLEHLQKEMKQIHEQIVECQAAYDALVAKDKQMERSFRNHFADFSQIVADQAYKFYRKRPKWHQRASMIPGVLYELANAVLTGVKPPFLHPDVHDYFKGVDQLDQLSNMPAVMDENNWAIMCRLRRTKIELEIRLRAIVQELAYAENTGATWNKAIQARKGALANLNHMMTDHRRIVERTARNKTIQLVLPAGQVEIPTTGHIEDFENTILIPHEDIKIINNAILKVGDQKLKWMRKQIDFRRVILSKEWEHAQMKMKLRHMKEELYSYKRLKLPKELQFYLKRKTEGYTDEQEHIRMEREALTTRKTIERQISDHMRQTEEVQVKCSLVEKQAAELEKQIAALNAKLSEKRLIEDPLEPLRVRKKLKKRMEILMARSRLIREVQANHTTIVMLQTELELLRLRTYPTLANYHSFG